MRVMTGTFDGVAGSLLLTGDGFKRGDSIALVGGATGPTATAEFDVSARGVGKALDEYAAELVDLKTRRKPVPLADRVTIPSRHRTPGIAGQVPRSIRTASTAGLDLRWP